MKTSDWIDALARDVGPVPRGLPARRLGVGWLLGAFAAVLAVTVFFGLRHDLLPALAQPVMWLKLGYPILLLGAGLPVLHRLSVPGRRPGWWVWTAVPLTVGVWVLGLAMMQQASPDQRNMLWMGSTWQVCIPAIAAVSLPVLIALLRAVRSLAPTRLRLAGAMAGLLAGATGTLAYNLHCPEMAVPFVALWNTLAVVLLVALGAWLGPRSLRW